MTIRVYSKILVLGPTTRNARAGSQSAIHPKLTGRRWARVTYRTHGHRRAARNNHSKMQRSIAFDMRIQTVDERNRDFLEGRVSFSRRLQVVIFGPFQRVLLLKILQIVVGSEAIKIFGTRRRFPLGVYFLSEHSTQAADT
jgi:hypothetical protein